MDSGGIYKVILLMIFYIISVPFLSFSQDNSNSISFQSTPITIKDPISNIRMGGYFRFLGYVRNFQEMYDFDVPNYYSGEYPQSTTIGIGTGYREPMMMLSISGKANKNVNIGTDLMLNSPFNGTFDNNSVAMYLGTNLYSTINSDYGKFGVHAGGIKWYRQSKLTVWAEEGYLRHSLFERAPYDPLSKEVSERYSKYYDKGSISQDLRFGNVAFQGVTLTGSGIDGPSSSTFSFQSIIGKTQHNIGEIVSYGKDDYSTGFRLNNDIGNGSNFALNYFTSIAATDSVKNNFRQFSIQSLEFNFKLKKLRFTGEGGIGSYESHITEKESGEMLVINLDIPKEYSWIPFKLQYSRIAPEAVNVNSSFKNTSVVELVHSAIVEEGADATIMSSFGGPINNLGYLANNREGFSLNTEFKIGDLFVSGGFGFYSELERINANFSYSHNTNGLMLSRISYFSSGYGPYKQFNSYYRGVFENVSVSDSIYVNDSTLISSGYLDTNGLPLFDKFYCSSDLHLKYKTRVFGKNLYLFSLTNYNTAQDFFSILPVTNSSAFIRHFNQQFDLCYELNKTTSFVCKYGLERVLGNKYTDIDDTDPYPTDNTWGVTEDYIPSYKPRNQFGDLLGFGFDIKLNDGAYLFLRHAAFHYYDNNFSATNIKGTETTLELKINF
ncbi:MAG: hypothetical protein HOA49_03515 [Flavobacteriales bacterium]|nr:hypothetical protein [Flavobacteriales bacterium]